MLMLLLFCSSRMRCLVGDGSDMKVIFNLFIYMYCLLCICFYNNIVMTYDLCKFKMFLFSNSVFHLVQLYSTRRVSRCVSHLQRQIEGWLLHVPGRLMMWLSINCFVGIMFPPRIEYSCKCLPIGNRADWAQEVLLCDASPYLLFGIGIWD